MFTGQRDTTTTRQTQYDLVIEEVMKSGMEYSVRDLVDDFKVIQVFGPTRTLEFICKPGY